MLALLCSQRQPFDFPQFATSSSPAVAVATASSAASATISSSPATRVTRHRVFGLRRLCLKRRPFELTSVPSA